MIGAKCQTSPETSGEDVRSNETYPTTTSQYWTTLSRYIILLCVYAVLISLI